jgi:HEAT repeat protein
VLRFLESEDTSVLYPAINAIGEITNDPELIESTLIPLLDSVDEASRLHVIRLFYRYKCDSPIVALKMVLSYEKTIRSITYSEVQANFMVSIFGSLEECSSKIIELLNDEDPNIRINAIHAIGVLTSYSSELLPVLQEKLDNAENQA